MSSNDTLGNKNVNTVFIKNENKFIANKTGPDNQPGRDLSGAPDKLERYSVLDFLPNRLTQSGPRPLRCSITAR